MSTIKCKTENYYFLEHFKPYSNATHPFKNSFLPKMLNVIDFGAFWVPLGKRKTSGNYYEKLEWTIFWGVFEFLPYW